MKICVGERPICGRDVYGGLCVSVFCDIGLADTWYSEQGKLLLKKQVKLIKKIFKDLKIRLTRRVYSAEWKIVSQDIDDYKWLLKC